MVVLSTGLKKLVALEGWKAALNDCVLVIYSGSPPLSPDNAESGTRLVTITKDGNDWSASKKQLDFFSIVNVGDDGDSITITLTPDEGEQEVYTITKTSSISTPSDFAKAICEQLASSYLLNALPVTETTEKGVVMESKFAGDGYIVSISASGAIQVNPSGALTPIIPNERGNGLHLEYVSGISEGIIEKSSLDTWKGEVKVTGTAQWFRIKRGDDGGGASTTLPRIQGVCGTTSDADLQLAGTSTLTQGTIQTIDLFRLIL